MQLAANDKEEVIYEYSPEPPAAQRHGDKAALPQSGPLLSLGGAAGARTSELLAMGHHAMDVSQMPVREAFDAFAQKEADAAGAAGHRAASSTAARQRTEFEALGVTPKSRSYEPPEQRFVRLQAEVAEFLRIAEDCAASEDPAAAADLLGADPAMVAAELKVLEQRLGGLAKDGPPAWQRPSDGACGPAGGAMSGSLKSQLHRFMLGDAGGPATEQNDGRVTYEISYTPSTSAIADSSKIAALESSIADIEKQLGASDPTFPFSDLQSAVAQLQKRVSLLDTQKIDAVRAGVHKVMGDMEVLAAKKAELEGGSTDQGLDRKVNQLYELCHRWSATSASLPMVVSRLQSLQALHQQSATFASRLSALEQQQDELTKLLDVTNAAVGQLGRSLQENMTTVNENMRTLEEKISKSLRA
mmetsp:Transcript_92854/g.262841  ORF Transcript_92854/g.262841 Transcript_92854/m.262841 type:complete len:416 (+) Transcript_92854:107-1354(+)